MKEFDEITEPMATGSGTAGKAAVEIASLPGGPTIKDVTRIIQTTIADALLEAEEHRQKLVALIRAVIARPEMFAKDASARASVERFLEESEARWGNSGPTVTG